MFQNQNTKGVQIVSTFFFTSRFGLISIFALELGSISYKRGPFLVHAGSMLLLADSTVDDCEVNDFENSVGFKL